jgi:hypothetical protein
MAVILALLVGLTACDVISTLREGWQYAKAVETELEASTGMKPQVGFNWRNGRLVTVTVTFPRIDEAKPLHEIADAVRRSVISHFKQTPGNIVLAFSIGTGSGPVQDHKI